MVDMTESKSEGKSKKNEPKKTENKTRAKKGTGSVKREVKSSRDSNRKTSKASKTKRENQKNQDPSWMNRISDITNSAFKIAKRTTDGSIKVGKSILKNQDQLKVMLATGQSLKDLREVTGLTISELSDAINLRDRSLWEAVEDGTATISFELILRLAALLARNDPVPFILKYTRTYNPELWKILNDWGLGRLPLQYEREREFINIYRRHDAARQLSDEGFEKVLGLTRKSFEMALHFIAENENITVKNDKSANGKEESSVKDSDQYNSDNGISKIQDS